MSNNVDKIEARKQSAVTKEIDAVAARVERLRAILPDLNLSLLHLHMLLVIETWPERNGPSVSQLSQALGLSRATGSQVVKRLGTGRMIGGKMSAGRSLVLVRSGDGADKRLKIVQLSASGKEAVAAIKRCFG